MANAEKTVKVGHSPGPWYLVPQKKSVKRLAPLVCASDRIGVARMVDRRITSPGTTIEELRSNAHLIAAAPTMLAACRAVIQFSAGRNHSFHCASKSGAPCDCPIGLARAAITKFEASEWLTLILGAFAALC